MKENPSEPERVALLSALRWQDVAFVVCVLVAMYGLALISVPVALIVIGVGGAAGALASAARSDKETP